MKVYFTARNVKFALQIREYKQYNNMAQNYKKYFLYTSDFFSQIT